jgi:hypothetical protein
MVRRFIGKDIILPALLGLWFLTAGCGSDTTAPRDKLPGVTEEAATTQAGYVANALSELHGAWLTAMASKATEYHSFTQGDVSGSFTLDYFLDGVDSSKEDANEAHVYTNAAQNEDVVVDDGSGNELITATFDVDVTSYDDGPPAEGTVDGGGNIKAGNYNTSFTIEGVELEDGSYPPSGTMTYTAGSHDVTVTFSGTRYAELTVGTDATCVDLDTGELMNCPSQ